MAVLLLLAARAEKANVFFIHGVNESEQDARAWAAKRPTHGLKRIPDSFGKLVIVDGIQPFYTDEFGISYVSLMDFLMKPEIIA